MSTKAIGDVLDAVALDMEAGKDVLHGLIAPRGILNAAARQLAVIERADRLQRDVFAAAALPACITQNPDNYADAAKCAYKYADAMMAERDRP